MSMFFSPSLTALIGNRVWWPGGSGRQEPPAVQNPAP
jgi:hypothetical protein